MILDKLFLANESLGSALELVAVSPDMYNNGVRQSTPVGYIYDVLVREHASDKLRVRIAGAQQMETPLNGFGVPVTFTDLKVQIYNNRNAGTIGFKAYAKAIKPVDVKPTKV